MKIYSKILQKHVLSYGFLIIKTEKIYENNNKLKDSSINQSIVENVHLIIK